MKGILQGIEEKQKRDGTSFYQLNIGGVTYSLFDEKLLQGVSQGDEIQFFYKNNGKYKNIQTLEKATSQKNGSNGGNGGFSSKYSPEGIKLSCLRSATELLSDSKMDPEKKVDFTLEAAKRFEGYATGMDVTDL